MPDEEVFHDMVDEVRGRKIATRVMMEGKVQNVGLRRWIKEKATKYHVDGWARNKKDDCVEALFIGTEKEVKEMVKLCYQGPSFASIKKVKIFPQPDTDIITKGFVLMSGA